MAVNFSKWDERIQEVLDSGDSMRRKRSRFRDLIEKAESELENERDIQVAKDHIRGNMDFLSAMDTPQT
jgi:hypothetical protein